METFISCDWGTSSFRLRLVRSVTGEVLAEISTGDGIRKVYTEYSQQQLAEDKRLDFYLAKLKENLSQLQLRAGEALDDVPVIISGMASANIGMMELPYLQLPAAADGNGFITQILETTEGEHRILLVSGLKTDTDVVRGEEVQLAGAMQIAGGNDMLFIFPGTHSKHIEVRDNKITGVHTYMTGEWFDLLFRQSILSGSMVYDALLSREMQTASFRKGVETGLGDELLHSAFMVRTNQLFGRISKAENYFFLSGILIGTEMKQLRGSSLAVAIVADRERSLFYRIAAETIGLSAVHCFDADEAVIRGQIKMYNTHRSQLINNTK
jgi:2-dehydro-3-deoxygalactonokinase